MELVGVQNKRSRRRGRVSIVLSAAAVLMLVIVRGSFAAPADKITICHATNSASQPYISVTDSLDGSNGSSQNDHTLHTGPIATSEEVAQQLKDDQIDWGDIIPPVGDFAGLNWTEEGQAIYNNDCSFAVAGDDGTDETADDSSDSSDSQDDSADAQDDSSDSQDDSADAQDDSSDSQDDSADAQDDSSDSQDDSADAQDDSSDGSDVQADDSLADDGQTDDGSTPTDDGSDGDVLGRTITRPLATTGSETTVLALIGFAMLMVGATLRFGRFGREVYASASSSQTPADLLAKAMQARSRHWTCRK
jgi:hypothetical protein